MLEPDKPGEDKLPPPTPLKEGFKPADEGKPNSDKDQGTEGSEGSEGTIRKE